MNELLNELIGFTFEVEFNEFNLNRFNMTRKIKPITDEFNKIKQNDDNNEEIEKVENTIIEKIKNKIKLELEDEKDLVNVYNSKVTKFLDKIKKENLSNDIIINKIKEIVETPLEGEIAKHNKIKVITIKINNKESLDVLFYVKYKQIDGYNKQIKSIVSQSI
jgi:hypothetical protein